MNAIRLKFDYILILIIGVKELDFLLWTKSLKNQWTYLTAIIPARKSKKVSAENRGSGVTVCISQVPFTDTFWQVGLPPDPIRVEILS